ncbi:Glucan 1,3-beta-glucosidase [Grifola frondosa]|uniref:Glucan 1,3-beta-glucosidase n=1 Tax=Grifola frondosa TaxID=5627 RepID=A0A1C7M6I7_GRIFR|nr:Glucan 1,3-beta-glucosidase [Grifola frondosa]
MLLRPVFTCWLLLGGSIAARQCRLVTQLIAGNSPQAPFNNSTNVPSTPTNVSTSQPSQAASPNVTGTDPSPFNYGKDIIRGVNLGGWFVLEPWITPTRPRCLQNHWDTWITQDDFAAIKAAGLNHVRMQVGYWSIPITSADTNYTTSVSPYIAGAWPYLLRALNWAKNNSLHVILDLHGAPGSQNGFDNSGQRGAANWGEGSNVNRTLDIIRFITENLGGMIDVLELLNEPVGYTPNIGSIIGQYWQDGYQVVRQTAGSAIEVMIGDAFLGVQNWEHFLLYPQAQGVFMDFHEYQIFNYDQIDLSLDEHLNYSCPVADTLTSYANSNLFTIIGEWSNAVTDCATWVNGRGVGARWDGSLQPNQPVFGSCDGWSGDMSTFSDDYKTFLRKYWESQVEIGENIQGWVFWTWKTESADDWSYQKGLEGGWIPQDPTDRMYPNICS